MPSMKNCRNPAEASQRPSGPVTVANRPIMNDPVILTTSVPQGNVSPTLLATQPENHQRARLPRPPPIKIHNAFHILDRLNSAVGAPQQHSADCLKKEIRDPDNQEGKELGSVLQRLAQ